MLTEGSDGSDTVVVNAFDSLGNTAFQQTIAVTARSGGSGGQADTWTGASAISSSDWFNISNWSVEVPAPNDQVVIDNSFGNGDAVTIQSGNALAGSLTLANSALLTVDGALDVSDPAGSVTNSGTIIVNGSGSAATASASFAGSVTNNAGATISVQGTAASSQAFAGTAIFEGAVTNSGVISVSGVGATANVASATFESAVINTGTITVAGTTSSIFQATATFTGTVQNTDGVVNGSIAVGNGGQITFQDGATLTGGTLTIGSGGEAAGQLSGATFDGVTVHDFGTLQVDGSQLLTTLTLIDGTVIDGSGTIVNGPTGTIEVSAGNGVTEAATLEGVTVTNNGVIEIDPTGSGA